MEPFGNVLRTFFLLQQGRIQNKKLTDLQMSSQILAPSAQKFTQLSMNAFSQQ